MKGLSDLAIMKSLVTKSAEATNPVDQAMGLHSPEASVYYDMTSRGGVIWVQN